MSKINSFSSVFFGVVMALFCYACFDYASAETIPTTETQSTKTLTICDEGYYLSSCDQKVIGTNWLKGIPGTTTTNGTPDYYSYDASEDATVNMTNLRKFFAGLEPISYKDASGNARTVLPSDYLQHRNTILSNFCINFVGQLATRECKKCPNGAQVSASSVERGVFFRNIIKDSWRVYTIADCYVDSFSDRTGTYIYAPITATTSTNMAKKCYYSNNVEGDTLVSE